MEKVFLSRWNITVTLGRKVRAPWREDRHPSVVFLRGRKSGRIFWIDHSKNPDEKDYKGWAEDKDNHRDIVTEIFTIEKPVKMKTIVKRIYEKEWTDDDLAPWAAFGIGKGTLKKYKTILAHKFEYEKDGEMKTISESSSQIVLWDVKTGHKVYWIDEQVKAMKHMSLFHGDIMFGYDQVPEGSDDVFLCAGEKDTLALYANTGHYGVALNSETANLSVQQYVLLKEKAKRIWAVYDPDETGIASMKKLWNWYMIPGIKLPELDLSDWFRFLKAEKHSVNERKQKFDQLWEDTKRETTSSLESHQLKH